jgi:hypothetical protein
LERLLGQHPSVLPTGELYQFFVVREGPDDRCSCGVKITDCPFWKAVYSRFFTGTSLPREALEASRRIVEAARWRRGLPLKGSRHYLDYGPMMRELMAAITAELPPAVCWIADSSKSAYQTVNRPIALRRLVDVDVRVIHLVRDVRAVMWSEGGRGSNLSLAGVLRRRRLGFVTAFAGWLWANHSAGRLAARLGADRYLRVRYEDLALHPERELPRIGAFLGLDLRAPGGDDALLHQQHHQLAGNRARFAQKLILKPDLEWEDKLPRFHRLLALALARPLLKKYGYI